MSKRGEKFERKENEAYYTPPKALVPLLPVLRAHGVRTFVEPCCGDGQMVMGLQAAGLICLYSGDIVDGQDALLLDHDTVRGADAIITNPPYERRVMHPIIDHLRKLKPSWFLLEADWLCTYQSTPLMQHCSDVIPIGRVRWIPGTTSDGFDNYVWCRFDLYPHQTSKLHRMTK